MAVGETHSASAIVVAGRPTRPSPEAGGGRTDSVHGHYKPASGNAVFSFVDEDPGAGRGRINEIAHAAVDPVPLELEIIGNNTVLNVVQPGIQSDAANPGIGTPAVLGNGSVAGTFKNVNGGAEIRTDQRVSQKDRVRVV